jgi:glucosamine--fructose-6-phosphate aminotransferase (isomerizing)
MCGIVGYVGNEEACDILIEALKRLEYRGYDSAGIAIWNQGTIAIGRKKGKVDELKKTVNEGTYQGSLGLAHTRWATHGTPSERNAHPHKAGDVVVVHNGIIENYMELKKQLNSEGHNFLSDTDTEVIPHMIVHHMDKGKPFLDAVRATLKDVTGSYASAS